MVLLLLTTFSTNCQEGSQKTAAGIINYKLSNHLLYFITLDSQDLNTINTSNKYITITKHIPGAIADFKEYLPH